MPRFGEYSHSMYYNYYYYGLNTFDPAVDKTGDKLMDMSNLIHDVGFTGSRTGRKAALTPVVKNGTTVYETVKNADGSDRLYPDSTGQQRYEFLDQMCIRDRDASWLTPSRFTRSSGASTAITFTLMSRLWFQSRRGAFSTSTTSPWFWGSVSGL